MKNDKTQKGVEEMLVLETSQYKKRNEESSNTKKLSPVEEALKEFKGNNGYEFLDMIEDEKLLKKHLLKQHQIKNYDDDDFLEIFQDKQIEEE